MSHTNALSGNRGMDPRATPALQVETEARIHVPDQRSRWKQKHGSTCQTSAPDGNTIMDPRATPALQGFVHRSTATGLPNSCPSQNKGV